MDHDIMRLAVELYTKLGSGSAVARRLDISRSRAYRLLHAGGVDLPDRHSSELQQRKKKLHAAAAVAAAAAYADGMSSKDMQDKFGVGMWAIRTAARDAGVPMRSCGGRCRKLTDAQKLNAVGLYQRGWSQAKIAAKFSSAQPVVSRVLRASGVEMRGKNASGAWHGNWKGGRVRTSAGYVSILMAKDDHHRSMADNSGYALEHRVVMARLLGRTLSQHETVHHINGDKSDNRPVNLQLRFGKHGRGEAMHCADCGSINVIHVHLNAE